MIQPDDPGARPDDLARPYKTGHCLAFVVGLIIGAALGALILGPIATTELYLSGVR